MRNFAELLEIDDVNDFIANETCSFLYIYSTNCSVCHGLLPKVEQLLKKYPKIAPRKVNAEKVRDIASKLSVFTVPTLLLFINGKEYIREGRFVSIDGLDEKINKIYKLAIEGES